MFHIQISVVLLFALLNTVHFLKPSLFEKPFLIFLDDITAILL